MEIDIRMPALSAPDARAKLTKWLKPAGAAIRAGDILAEVVSGKTTMEIEAEASGVLTEIVAAAGTGGLAADALLARLMQADKRQPSRLRLKRLPRQPRRSNTGRTFRLAPAWSR